MLISSLNSKYSPIKQLLIRLKIQKLINLILEFDYSNTKKWGNDYFNNIANHHDNWKIERTKADTWNQSHLKQL